MFFTLSITKNAFDAVVNCNAYITAILHIHMVWGMVERPKFVLTLTIPEKAFGDGIECSSVLEAIFQWYLLPENAFEAVFDCNAYLEAVRF